VKREHLKLTAYFGERDRTPRGLLADELLDLYARHAIDTSVLLRGAEGFGALQHLRTDRLLSLSEDLPVVAIAIDTEARIEALIEPLLERQRRGLVTLERVRLLDAASQSVQLPPELDEATKLTLHLARRERVAGKPAHVAVCELLRRRGIAGASVLLGVDGTRGGERARARFFSRNAEVPTLIVAVGSGRRIAQVLPELAGLLAEPRLTLERVRVCKRDGELLAMPHELPASDERGLELWQKLTIYSSQSSRGDGPHPLHLQIVRELRTAGAAGATSVRGIWGFHDERVVHGDRFLQLSRDVPVVTSVIDAPARIGRAFAIIDELTAEHGLVTSEMVPALRAMSASTTRGGLELADHAF
jgi:PII-like signaling protein